MNDLIFAYKLILLMNQESTSQIKENKKNAEFGSKTTNNFQKNKSLDSTQKMSLSYAHLPMRKDTAQWNVSAAVLRHSVASFSVPKDSRFK